MKSEFVDILYLPPKSIEIFWGKVDKNSPPPEHDLSLGPCWDWTGLVLPTGYGVFRYGIAVYTFRQVLSHRLAYELVNGDVPDGKILDHLCRNRSCCNPAHLEPVTAGENVRRGKGFAGVNFRKTVCPQGHKLEGDNLSKYKLTIGKRSCVTCERTLKRERRWRKKKRDARNQQISGVRSTGS